MNFSSLTAISPIDGRYQGKTNELQQYFSEFGLIKYRVFVEIEYFIALCEIPLPQLISFDNSLFNELRKIYIDFTAKDAQKIKDIMESAVDLEVPNKVDYESGPNWGSIKG